MLKIKIELIPFGIGQPKELGRMEIFNDLTGTKTVGNYGFRIFRKGTDTVFRSGDVKGYRRHDWSVWYLLYMCLKEVYE